MPRKRSAAAKRPIRPEDRRRLTFDVYQLATRRTVDPSHSLRERLAQFALGLTGEAGEAAEVIKKHLFHDRRGIRDHLKEELGDVLWYLARLADEEGISLEDLARGNLRKLRARRPEPEA